MGRSIIICSHSRVSVVWRAFGILEKQCLRTALWIPFLNSWIPITPLNERKLMTSDHFSREFAHLTGKFIVPGILPLWNLKSVLRLGSCGKHTRILSPFLYHCYWIEFIAKHVTNYLSGFIHISLDPDKDFAVLLLDVACVENVVNAVLLWECRELFHYHHHHRFRHF